MYSAIASIDGYVADADGSFGWGEPDEEVHAFVNDLERPISTHLYGRRLYEVMAAWETMETEGEPAPVREYAEIWRAADKIVYSTTLASVSTARTRLVRAFDPDEVRDLKAASELAIGGAELAGHAFRAGLVDEVQLFVAPVAVGGGTPALPSDVRIDFELVDERRFASGFAYLRYRVAD